MNNRIAHESSVHTHRRGLDRVSLKSLVAAIGGALGVGLVPLAQAQVPASTSVVNSVNHALKNASTVTQNSNTWSVLSNTTSGNTAFNSFDTFNVAKNDTVNLYRPSTTSNLVNLVWNAAAQIDGTINSYTYTTGSNGPVLGNAVSGSVFFADPYGIVVGGDAVLNVGALSLSAPTEKFMESMLDANGNPVSASVTTLLQGQEPVNDTATANACASGKAMICVDGAVNATNAVRVHATTIEVGGQINVTGTGADTLATAVNVAGSTTPMIETDGNTIRLIAEDSNTADTGGGDAAANAAVTVTGKGKLTTGNVAYANSKTTSTSSADSWGEVALTATTSAASDYSDPTKKAALKGAGDLLLDQSTYNSSPVSLIENNAGTLQNDINLATADKLGQLAYVRAFSTANVELQSGTAINASGNVLLQSGTTASATTDATSKQSDGSIPAMLTGMYGAVYSKASTLIDNGASVTSSGNVTALSTTDNTLGVQANTIATKSTSVLGATVAWSQAAVDANTQVNGSVTAQGLAIGAQNSNDFSTKANASTSNTGGSIGLAGAVSRQTVNATASLGSAPSMSGTGNITIAAETDTSKNETVASTGTTAATPPASSADNSGDNADLTGSMGNVTSNTGSDGKTGSSTGGGLGASLPFKIGAAVAFTDSSNTATATTAPGLTFTTPGNLAVQAIVSDAGIHNSAKSETASKEDSGAEGATGSGGSSGGGSGSGGTGGGTGGSGSTTVNVSAAVAYGNYTHNADAEIGTNDTITALNIGVDSQVVVPFDWTFGQTSLDAGSLGTLSSMGNSLDDFKKGATELKNLVTTAKAAPEEIMDGVTSYAGAFGDGSSVAIGGSVNYFGMANTNRAWVGSGSSLTSTAAASEKNWQSSLGWLTGAVNGNGISVTTTPGDAKATPPTADSSTFTWANSISVLAATNVAAFNLVGSLTPWTLGTSGTSAAIGGAFNYGGYANTTTAGLDGGVNVVSNNAVAVNANGADTLFVLSPISGKGGSAAIQGMVALTDVSDQTHATVSGSDNITATALGVNATNPLMVWSLTGALAMSSGAGIGISVGINDVTTNTLAMVGDNSADESSTPSPAPAETGGTIKTGTLTIAANTSGEAGGLSVAGSSISDAKPDPGNGTGDSAAPSGSGAPGAGLLSMLKSVGSMADKLRGGADGFQSALGKVDELTGGTVSNSGASSSVGQASSLLDKASSALSAATSGASGLQTVVGKLSSLGKKTGSGGSGSGSGSSSASSSFGIGISGAASVNIAKLGTQATLDGAMVEDQAGTAAADAVTLLAMNSANLVSAAGGAALSRTSNSSGGGDLAGAVAYSSVGDTTSAVMGDSGTSNPVTSVNANNVTVQALDNSQQIDAGIGVAAQIGGSGTTTTVAGSVSIGSSKNQTTASMGNSTLTGSKAAGNAVQVTAYDASAIGIGAGGFSLNTSSGDSVNGAVSLTYTDIADATNATVNATSVNQYGSFSLNALDGAQIVAVAATGSVSTGENSNSLTGAVVVNQIGDSTTASLGGGAAVNVSGALGVQAAAVAPGSSTLASLDLPSNFGAPASSYFDFSGGQLTQTLTNASNAGANAGTTATNAAAGNSSKGTATGTSNGWGSSIIAVAGDLGVSGNNVGLSFAYNKIANTHQVTIDNATLSTAGDIGLNAQDNTRIVGVAAGLGVATGDFAGMGSATYNSIGNTTGVVLGSTSDKSVLTNLTGSTISATAGDQSQIYSLAGSAAISTGTAAVGGAVGYNNIGDTTQATANNVAFDTTTTGNTAGVALQAQNQASIMAGALGAAISGGDVGLAVSFGWNQTGNTTLASLSGGSVNGLANATTGGYDGLLSIGASDSSTIQALSGAAAVSGSGAAAAAVSVQEIGDSTRANLQNALVQIGDANVTANTTALEQSIALGVAVTGDGSGTGSVAYNCIGDSLSNGNCSDSSTPSTSQPAGTSAFVSGIYSGTVAKPTPAAISDTLDVGATDSSKIQTLAVGVAVAGDAALGASVAVSDIGTATSATIGTAVPTSGPTTTPTQLDVGNATNVNATSSATIESLAVGAAASGDVSLAGSSSTNLIANTVNAAMTNVSTGATSTGATSTAPPAGTFDSKNATSIIATNGAQISSLAGALSGSGSVAVGAAVAVNDIGTNTTASFDGSGGGTNSTSANPSTWYQVGSLTVQAGATNPGTPSGLPGTLSTADTNNANIQTVAVSGAISDSASLAGSVAVNQITGNTTATIDQNAGVVANNSVGVLAGNDQGIDVLAGMASLSGSIGAGAGVVVNVLSGSTNAAIDNSSVTAYANGPVMAYVNGKALPQVANGTPASKAGLDGSMDVTNSLGEIFTTFAKGATTVASGAPAASAPSLASNTTTITGVAVNAVNQQHAATWSLGIAASEEVAGSAEVGVNVIGGTTSAGIKNGSQINQITPASNTTTPGSSSSTPPVTTYNQAVSSTQQVNVAAYNAQYAANYLADGALTTGSAAISAAMPVNTFNGTTQAFIADSNVNSNANSDGTDVLANSYQWSLNNVVGAAFSTNGSVNLTGAVSLFDAHTDAYVSGGTFNANNFNVLANSAIQSAQVGGALALSLNSPLDGSFGVSGMAMVNIDKSETSAKVENSATVNDSGDANVNATSSNTARALAAQLAFGTDAGIVGTVAVNVLGNSTNASVDNSTMTVGGTLNVLANDSQTVDDIIGGVGVGGIGFAGGVNVTLLQTQVGADIDNSVIANTAGNAGGVNVGATSNRNVNNVTGSGAGGIAGIGVSVGVLVAGTGGGIASDPNTSMLNNSSSTSNNNTDSRGADLTDIGQSGNSTLASGGNYGNLSNSDINNVNSATNYNGSWTTALAAGTMDGIAAGITGGSKVASSSDVNVNANATEGTTNTAGVGAGGVAAIGVSVASTTLNSQVNALVDGNSAITQARNVNITAGVADGTGAAASTQVATGSKAGNVTVGALGVNVGVADSSITNTVTAANNGSISGINQQGALNVAATDSSTASAGNGNPNVTVGIGVAVGTMVYTASRDSTIDAALGAGSTTQNFSNVIVNAADTGGANAQGVAGTGGIISGSGANITATDTSHVTSSVGMPVAGAPASTTTLANNAAVNVTASAKPTVTATANSTTVGVGVAVGVNLVKASANLTVNALIGAPAAVGANGSSVVFTQAPNLSVLNVLGTFAPTVTASGTGSVGGIIAANATAVTASSSGSNHAEIGSNVTLPTHSALVALAANSTPTESATANGKLGGLLIGGEFTSNANSNETTSAALDDAPIGQAPLQLGGLSITATGTDTNDAKTVSGSGALIGGLASRATTSALSTTSATLGQGWNFSMPHGFFNLTANQSYVYGGTADSHFGALFGGSGAYVSNTLGGSGNTATAVIGPHTSVVSGGDLIVQAQTNFSADKNNGGATSGAGGIISGDAAKVSTTLNAGDFAHVGSGDTLAAHGTDSNGNMSSVQVLAGAYANNIYDLASISIDGAVPIADAVTDITGNVANTIDIDQGSTIDSWGKVDIATYSQILGVAGQATGNANGLSGIAVSKSKAVFNSYQTVNIGSDPSNGEAVPTSGNVAVNINSIGGTYVIAGRDILNGRYTQLNPTAIAQAYVRAFIAIPHASANASATSNATLNMGPGSTANSDSDVAIGSTPGLFAPSADGEGHGYELGFIPVTQHSNSTTSQGTANTTLNGTVRAGTPGDLNISIDSNGNLTSNSQNYQVNGTPEGASGTGSSGVPFQAELLSKFNPTAYGSTNPNNLSAWVIGTTLFKTPTSTVLPQYGTPLYAQGGNVFLYGGTGGSSGTNTGFLTGSGNVTANGSPSITINNASDTFLVVPGAQVAFGLTGAVDVNDGATGASNIGGIAISQTPSTLQPSITINNNYAGTATPGDLILTNTVTNYGGAVTLYNAAGSIITQSINANAVSITAPNGNVAFNATPGNMNWFSGGDPASATDVSGSWFLQMLGNDFLTNGTWDANKVAAAIAQIEYVPTSTDANWLNTALASNYSPTLFSLPSGPERTPVVVLSGCMPEINGGPGDGCGGSVQLLSGGSDSYIPFVPWVKLATQSATPPPVVSGSTSASSSRTLTVNACNGTNCGYINIDAPYSVGGAGAWTVQTQQGLQNLIAAHQQGQAIQLFDYINGQYVPYQSPVAGNATGSIPLTDGAGNTLYFLSGTSFQPLLGTLASAGNSQLIGASYNLANGGSIVLNNVNANGGGSATLTGHIVSTGNGSLTVNNGYGQVLADNTTGLALQVNNINTGTAQPGVVTFVDSSRTLTSGTPVTTWYLSLSGNAPQIFTNDPTSGGSLVTLSTAQSAAMGGATQAYQLASSGNTLSYSPAAGQYYNWGVQSQVFRNVYFPGSDPWSFGTPGNGTTPDNAWTLIPGSFGTNATVALSQGSAYATSMSVNNYGWTTAAIAYHGCDKHGNCHYGTHHTGNDWNGDSASIWGFIYPLQGTLQVNVTQSASLPIAINFNTTQTNRVEVDSNADINLNGIISNTNAPQGTNTPDTLLYATNGGNIFQQNANALIWTHDLALAASGGGSIGTALNPIQVRIANSGSDPTATLVASTDGNINGIPVNVAAGSGGDGSININVDSAAATLPIKAVAQGSTLVFNFSNPLNPFQIIPVYGNINITGTGSLVSTNSAGVSVPGQAYLNCLSGLASGNCIGGSAVATNLAQTGEDVVGYAVSLSSSVGGIGAATRPLFVQTHSAMGEQGVLNANAMLGINMTDDGGDVLVGAIDSQHGDVTLTAPNGGIYDARAESSASTLTEQQQRKIWQQAGLLDGSSAQQTVTSSVNAAYTEYGQLATMGTVNPVTGAFVFTLTGNALQAKLAAYWPLAATYLGQNVSTMPTDPAVLQADVTQYFSARGAADVGLFNQWIGSGWQSQAEFAAYSPTYVFALSSTQLNSLQSSAWQVNQLLYSLNASALQAPASGGGVPPSTLTPTTVGTNFTPNISGQNVTLTAGSGGLGRLGTPLAINVADLQNLYQTGQLGGTLTQQTLAALAAANTPGDVVVYDNKGNAIAPQVLANILSNCATATTSCLVGDTADGVTVGSLSVTQTNPLFLSVAKILNGKASGAVYLQAMGDLDIGQLTATNGDMNVAATGNIQAAPGATYNATNPVLQVGNGNLVIAANGAVNFGDSAGDPLPILINKGQLLKGSAGTNLLLNQTHGDLDVSQAVANGLVSLQAPDGSIYAVTGQTTVAGQTIDLSADNNIGYPTTSGTLAALLVQLTGTGGLLNATAQNGALNIAAPLGDLAAGTIFSGQNLTLTDMQGNLSAQQLTSQHGSIFATGQDNASFHTVQANNGVQLDAVTGTLTTTGAVSSNAGSIPCSTNTELASVCLLGNTGIALGGNVTAIGGNINAILGNTSGTANVEMAQGVTLAASHGSVSISAPQAGDNLLMDAGADGSHSSNIQALRGIAINVGGNAQLGLLQSQAISGDAISITSGGAISGNGAPINLQARQGGVSNLTSVNDIGSSASPLTVDVNTLNATSSKGNIYLHGLGTLSVPMLSAFGNLNLAVDQALNFGRMNVGGNALISAAAITGTALIAGDSAQIASTGNTSLGTVGAGTTLAVNVGGNLAATTLQSGGATNLTAGQAMTLGQATSGGDLTATAGSNLTAATLQSGGNTALTATKGTLQVTHSLTSAGNATLQSGGDTTIQAMTVGGNVASTSGGNTTIVQANVTGTGNVNATGTLTLGTWNEGGDLTTQSGGDTAIGTLVEGGNLAMTSGGAIDVTQANVTGTGNLNAATNLTLGNWTEANNLTTQSGAATALGTVVLTAGNLQSSAVGNLTAQDVTVKQGNATLSSGADMNLAKVTTSGTLDATAVGTLQAATLSSGGDTALTSGSDMTLGNAQAGGALTAKSGGNLAATTLQSGGATNITAGQAMTLGQATSGGDMTAAAGTNLTAATLSSGGNAALTAKTGTLQVTNSLTSAGNATLQSGGDTTIQAMTVGGNVASTSGGNTTIAQANVTGAGNLNAATNLTLGNWTEANNLTTQSGGDTALGTVVLTAGDLASTAGGTLNAQSVNVKQDDATLASQGDMTLGSVTTAKNLTATTAGNLAATTLQSGGATTLTAAQAMTLGQATSGGDLTATAGSNLTAATLQSGGNAALTAKTGTLQVTHSLTSTGNATLQSGSDTDIQAMTVGGNVASTSGGNTNITQANVTGTGNLNAATNLTLGNWTEANNLTTQSGAATALGTVVLTVGDLASTAGGTLSAQSVNVQQGNATLASQGDMTLGSVTTAKDLTTTTAGNLTATTLQSGGATNLTAGQAMTLGQASSGGDLTATAGTNLTAATLQSGGNAALTAKTGTLQVTNSLTSAGNATLQSGGDTTIQAMTVGGNVASTSGGNTTIAQANVTGTGNLNAATNLTLGNWTEANNLTTQSGAATALGTVVLTAGDLASTAGGTLNAQSVNVQQGNATLASQGDMTLGSVTTAKNLTATTAGNLAATTLQSGGATTLTAAQAMTLGQATSGGDLTATAGSNLTAATLSSGGNAALTAKTGTLQVTHSLTSTGNATLQSGSDTTIQAMTVGGNVASTSGGNTTIAQANVTGTGNLDAAGTLTLGTWNGGNSLTTQSGAATALGTVALTSGDLQSTAGTTLNAQQVNVKTGSAMLTAGTDLVANTIVAGTDVDLKAGNTVQTTQVNAGHDINVNAGGDVNMVASTAGHDMNVDSGGALTIHTAFAGDAITLAAQQMTFDDVEAPNTISLWARDGNILANTLRTRDAYAQANGDIVLDAGYIGDRINLQANNITAKVTQTSTGQPLYSVLTGYQNGVANRITVDADASQRWMIDRLAAVVAGLTTTAPNADIASGRIMQTMALDTSIAKVRMNQQSALLVPADVQLMQPTYDFQLYQDGIHSLTDAFVIRYSYGFQIQTPNYVASHQWMDPDYLGESALRNNGRFLDTDDLLHGDDGRKHAIPAWIRTDKSQLVQPVNNSQPAVNLQAQVQAPK